MYQLLPTLWSTFNSIPRVPDLLYSLHSPHVQKVQKLNQVYTKHQELIGRENQEEDNPG
jgi:hypothetical protein